MMKKLSILLGLTFFAFGLEGCETLSSLPFLGGGSDDAGDVSVSPVTTAPNTLPANPSEEGAPDSQDPNAPEAGDPEFEDPVVAGEDAALPAPDGLIPITDRDTAIKILEQNQGRQNPFATLPVPAEVTRSSATTQDFNPKLPVFPYPPISPLAQKRSQPFSTPQEGSQTPLNVPQEEPPTPEPPKLPVFPYPPIPPQAEERPVPQSPSNTPLEWTGEDGEFNPDDLPALPEPTIAQGLTVTGVVNLGGSVKAIVQDGDGKSRYVSPGEYLGSGQVLVKRIEMNRGPQPVVIFEELGIEVTRAVGEPPANNTNA